MSGERGEQREPDATQENGVSRRTLLKQAGRAGLGVAAGVPLAGWLAACSAQAGGGPTPVPTATPTVDPTATPDTRPITIAITGDIMLGRSVNDQLLATHDRFP
ncbi:MAG: hypothetical protein ACXVCO_20900, partial [Ktedonobacterales bacterium]